MTNFEFLKKIDINFNRYECNCGIVHWVTHTVHNGLCGECNTKNKDIYDTLHIGVDKSVNEINEEFLSHFETTGYRRLEQCGVKLSRHKVNYMLAGVCRYIPLFTNGLVYGGSVKHNGLQYVTNKFVSTQTCIRFQDSNNVAITNRHYTNFKMLGQHIFEHPLAKFSDTWIQSAFIEIMTFLKRYFSHLSLYTIHESTWSDNIHEGDSLEIFINGIEVFNQVYTSRTYVDKKPLVNRYVDLGGGLDRLVKLIRRQEAKTVTKDEQIVSDHIQSIVKLYMSGLYFCKRGTGHTIKKLLNRVNSFPQQLVTKKLAEYSPDVRIYFNNG